MAFKPTIDFLPQGIISQDLYPKVAGMMDHIIQNFEKELEDTRYKYSGPEVVRQEVIEEIVIELGFSYIQQIMSTITNFEFNQLLQFLSLINLLKGSRDGLSLILNLLGFDSVIYEWWELTPPGPVDTFNLVVIVNSSNVPDLNATLDKVKVFTREYVYPTLNIVDFRFTLFVASKNITMAGFVRNFYNGTIVQRI